MNSNAYTIFYTDDDADDQEVFREIVAEINQEVYIFTQNNGAELMRLLENPPPEPHMVFLDLNMPVKNGYQVLSEIAKTEKIKGLPIIVFSTSSDADAIKKTRELGATRYIVKPDSYNELKKILRDMLATDWTNFTTTDGNYLYSHH